MTEVTERQRSLIQQVREVADSYRDPSQNPCGVTPPITLEALDALLAAIDAPPSLDAMRSQLHAYRTARGAASDSCWACEVTRPDSPLASLLAGTADA